jgi:hypothetical protein
MNDVLTQLDLITASSGSLVPFANGRARPNKKAPHEQGSEAGQGYVQDAFRAGGR